MPRRARFFNVLTLLMLGLTVVVLGIEIVIAVNPQTRLNPFPPVTVMPRLVVATRTTMPEVAELLPTWTPTLTATSTATRLPTRTPTATPTASPTHPPSPTVTATPRATRSPYPFTYQLNYETPYYSCNWAGVAGLVKDLEGNPLTGYSIHVWGGGVDLVANSGDTPMYGPSGWEEFFNDHPLQVSGEYKVQLHDRAAPHAPVSEQITLDFTGYCAQSMAFIVFTQNY
ncbi:MAG: hypothetical protein U9Q70_01940 [Chloroflexota bacterium]|nr:hypothetical protein [Chloroflexota bacterium]